MYSACRYFRLIDNIVWRCRCFPHYLDSIDQFSYEFNIFSKFIVVYSIKITFLLNKCYADSLHFLTCTCMYWYVLICTSIYWYVLVCTDMYLYVQVIYRFELIKDPMTNWMNDRSKTVASCITADVLRHS